MKTFFRWFHKLLLGWTVWLYFRPRVRYEEKGSMPRGPVLLVSNHKNHMDFLLMELLFYFRYVRCLVGKTFYESSGLITFLLRMLGAIKVDRFSFDMEFFYQCMDALKKGQTLLVFPEGKFSTDGTLAEFRDTAALLALQAGVPVVPVYHGYDYRFFHRTPVVIGKPMDLSAECPTQNPGPEELKRLTALLRGKIVELREMAEK